MNILVKDLLFKVVFILLLIAGVWFKINFAANLITGSYIFSFFLSLFIGLVVVIVAYNRIWSDEIAKSLDTLKTYNDSKLYKFNIMIWNPATLIIFVGLGWWFTASLAVLSTVLLRLSIYGLLEYAKSKNA